VCDVCATRERGAAASKAGAAYAARALAQDAMALQKTTRAETIGNIDVGCSYSDMLFTGGPPRSLLPREHRARTTHAAPASPAAAPRWRVSPNAPCSGPTPTRDV